MLALAGLILVGIGCLTYTRMSSTAEADRRENDTYVVMEMTTRLLGDLADMQAHERGYLITGKERYREYYQKAFTNACDSLHSLKTLTQDNPRFQGDLKQCEALLAGQNEQFLEMMYARAGKRSLETYQMLPADQPTSCIVSLRRQLAGLHRDEAQQLAASTAKKEEQNRKALSALTLGASFSVVLLFAGVFLLRDEILRRRAAERFLAMSHKELEKLVATRTADLQATLQELEHFSYALVHDLRAPLRAVEGFSTMLRPHVGDSQRACDLLERVGTGVQRMDRLILDALSYNQLLRQPIKLEPVDLADLVRELLVTSPNLQPELATTYIETRLPTVLGCKTPLSQCLSNLLDNAAKFAVPGIKPEIHIRSEAQKSKARIFIQDNGVGIPKAQQERMFELFQRGSTAIPGTGLGLAIVKKAIERLGGNVGVESEEGKGSTFWIELTLAEDVTAKPVQPHATDATPPIGAVVPQPG